jgi:hypothetical protein
MTMMVVRNQSSDSEKVPALGMVRLYMFSISRS